MTYTEATEYLFNAAPLFQNIGAGAYKEGLSNTHRLDAHFGHPHCRYRTIHVGGTNGKGSVSHTLAAILQAEGYKVGLYTSPHLMDFRERIRVNGQMIPEERVIRFVEDERSFFEPLHPSFFELTTALAFQYFAEEQIDIAVIEVGLGGRLDCTNIIRPELSIVTNISIDHVQFLGNTLPQIASEKAGIIKCGVPALIGENVSKEVKDVFATKAKQVSTVITFAEDEDEVTRFSSIPGQATYDTRHFGMITGALSGFCQEKNAATILTAVRLLRKRNIRIDDASVRRGFSEVCSMTGLMGRWQVLCHSPLTICDTAHNKGGLSYIFRHLASLPHASLHFVFGMVSDKDVSAVLQMLPRESSHYYFTQASVQRALPATELLSKARQAGLDGYAYADVASALDAARKRATPDDIIYIGGSTFIVADMLNSIV